MATNDERTINGAVLILFERKSTLGVAICNQLVDLGVKEIQDVKSPTLALDLIRNSMPTIIIMDWELSPFYQNAEFLQKLRRTLGARSVPVVICTDTLGEEVLAIAGEYDVEKMLLKPSLRVGFKVAMVHLFEELGKPPPIRKLIQKLDVALERKDKKEIDAAVKQLHQADPTLPRAQVEYASLLLREGRLDEAEKIAKKVQKTSVQGNNLRATNLLGRIYMMRGNYTQAIELLNKADVLSPNNIERLVMMGDCYFGLGDTGLAKINYAAALNVDPSSQEARRGLGMLQLTEGEINKALSLFHDTTNEEELASIFNTAGVAAARSGNYERAVQLYLAAKKPVRTDTLLAKICFNMGLAYRKWNRASDAEHWFKETLALNPNHDKAQRNLQELLTQEPPILEKLGDSSMQNNAGAYTLEHEEGNRKPQDAYSFGAADPEHARKQRASSTEDDLEISLSVPQPLDDEEDL